MALMNESSAKKQPQQRYFSNMGMPHKKQPATHPFKRRAAPKHQHVLTWLHLEHICIHTGFNFNSFFLSQVNCQNMLNGLERKTAAVARYSGVSRTHILHPRRLQEHYPHHAAGSRQSHCLRSRDTTPPPSVASPQRPSARGVANTSHKRAGAWALAVHPLHSGILNKTD